jgi:hypothetical protein
MQVNVFHEFMFVLVFLKFSQNILSTLLDDWSRKVSIASCVINLDVLSRPMLGHKLNKWHVKSCNTKYLILILKNIPRYTFVAKLCRNILLNFERNWLINEMCAFLTFECMHMSQNSFDWKQAVDIWKVFHTYCNWKNIRSTLTDNNASGL